MANKSAWSPDKVAALKMLIRQTIDAAGAADPASIPHRVKERLKGQATGDLDIEAYVKQVLAERKKKRG
ncbi:MAG: hypothetical protein WD076_06320 [Parvularculaceae bacterium]